MASNTHATGLPWEGLSASNLQDTERREKEGTCARRNTEAPAHPSHPHLPAATPLTKGSSACGLPACCDGRWRTLFIVTLLFLYLTYVSICSVALQTWNMREEDVLELTLAQTCRKGWMGLKCEFINDTDSSGVF